MGVIADNWQLTQQTVKTMDSLKGATLLKADGSKIEAEKALENKDLVLYYFSAHWCPPCRQFTPMLSDFYGEVSDDLEIVFVASDLKQKYGVQGIPMLVVVKKDGSVVTKDGRSHVVSKPPKQAVQGWKA